ncbi:hypothetical protein MXL46_10120 [Heyndrickxia sporothermodurans]|uniref:DGQHR domain-containing protein n=1 Tax=Heyndrickxia sporothermodurans TaxID=46224 RepID=A0A150KL68_9BACI|nr:DNA sulfur modification protein DndB [Heyndrickxia sporothermodurans]KYC89949.1 hypothetical protein B4102_3956 [Heyndrickxia sporothermodurans]MBL5782253.1 hypothetical protein [Heyndrickxia sporothermodurans]MBL5794096.1 hypothetical protein [Heyndrickxia sporothermodurans]MBL5855108.1 hypothetical protein [Heyndrickxia sporothermodurans]MBL5866715.1 hypothetical protein [Heyndrickxia sporothermodurans]
MNFGTLVNIGGTGYRQFGKKVLVTQMRFSTLQAIFEVDQEVQRQLDPQRRLEIREYILHSIENEHGIYFSPFIFSSRNKINKSEKGWELEPGCKMYILDGMHRAAAFASAINYLNARKETAEEVGQLVEAETVQGYIDQLKNYPVAMQIFLDLNQQEERQLFTDLNTERKEAHVGLIMQFDQRDEYTDLTRKVAKQLESKIEIEQRLSRLTSYNSAVTSLVVMRRCLIALFEGLLTIKRGKPKFAYCEKSEVPDISKAFFDSWIDMFPKQMGNRNKFVSGLTGIQLALAKTVHQLVQTHSITYFEAINRLKILKKYCNWKHTDPLFAHLYDPASGKIKYYSSTTAIQKTSQEFLAIIEKERK